MKHLLISFLAFLLIVLYSCQKDSAILSSSDLTTELAASDRGGGPGGHHHGGPGHHHGDSLHFDSLHHHHFDSLWHHHLDSLHHPWDSLHHPHDTTGNPGHGPHQGGGGGHHGGGWHHPHDSTWTPPAPGCQVPPAVITVAELPQAAQNWLATNAPNAVILQVRKVTKPDCMVIYVVKVQGAPPIRFDADGNKIG